MFFFKLNVYCRRKQGGEKRLWSVVGKHLAYRSVAFSLILLIPNKRKVLMNSIGLQPQDFFFTWQLFVTFSPATQQNKTHEAVHEALRNRNWDESWIHDFAHISKDVAGQTHVSCQMQCIASKKTCHWQATWGKCSRTGCQPLVQNGKCKECHIHHGC